jgi:hypothetical protein
MIAIVSSMSLLLGAVSRAARCSQRLQQSNGCAEAGYSRRSRVNISVVVCSLAVASWIVPASAQTPVPAQPPQNESGGKRAATFLAGGALGLATHEAGHIVTDLLFGEKPGLQKVDFHGLPFFAITHRSGLPPRREFTISSAGFWVQHAENEWMLTRRSGLRHERAPLAKGMFAFNVLASVAYAGAAFGKTGPAERDTRGIASSARIDERWVGAMILAPALLDAWRYYHPDAKWAAWTSRGVKVGMVVLVVR